MEREADLLASSDWDVALLQEVNSKAWAAVSNLERVSGAVSAFDDGFPTLDGKRPHGVALLVRDGLALTDPEPLTGLPRPGRGMGATVEGWDVPISVCSWHAPNAAASGPAIKMQGYLAFLGWIARQRAATVVGFDSNHWETSTELDLTWPSDPAHGWYLEQRFFGATPPHGLRDAYRDYLRSNDAEYRRLRETLPPNGPLAITYTRGSKQRPTPDRFDYVFISEDFKCAGVDHRYDASLDAGSDHALVIAELALAGSK
ncbi:MAG: hypothetical protein U0W40_13635 [Acidimicrobiia bacterium]